MKRRYVTSVRLAQLERMLSDRDRAVIETLDRLRVATTAQLRRLHFADLTEASAARQAPRTLRRLAEHGVLIALPRQVGGLRAGSQAAIWALGIAGQKLASAAGPAGGPMRRPWVPGLPFLAHRLAGSELYVALVEASRAGSCELLNFDAEPLSWRRFVAAHGARAVLKPDAFVRLGVGAYERGAFIEIDRATESAAAIARKCRAYRRYWEAGREQARRGYFPQVVFSVPDETRKSVLVDVCAHQPEDSWPLWRIVLEEDLVPSLIGAES